MFPGFPHGCSQPFLRSVKLRSSSAWSGSRMRMWLQPVALLLINVCICSPLCFVLITAKWEQLQHQAGGGGNTSRTLGCFSLFIMLIASDVKVWSLLAFCHKHTTHRWAKQRPNRMFYSLIQSLVKYSHFFYYYYYKFRNIHSFKKFNLCFRVLCKRLLLNIWINMLGYLDTLW